MPHGWDDVLEWGTNPNYDPQFSTVWNDPRGRRQLRLPTGKQRCPDCEFVTDDSDPIGQHTCPELTDGEDNKFTVGDEVFVISRDRIKWGEVMKWNQKTQKLSVLINAEEPYVVVLNSTRKTLRMDHFDDAI